MTRRRLIVLGLLLLGVAALIVLRLLVYRDLQGRLTWSWPDPSVAAFRRTSVAVAVIVGTALAVSGVLLQALLRNPLASPFVLGVSGGAALGVVIATYVGHVLGRGGLGPAASTLPAMIGAIVTLVVVYLLGQRRGWLDPVALILVGVVVASICGSMIMFLHHLVPTGLRGDLVTWMAGSISQGVAPGVLVLCGTLTALAAGVAVVLGRAMDAATLGDDEARSVGVALGPLRIGLFLVAGLLAALAVSLAGPIGFVGLIAPHAARLLLGSRHDAVVVGAALLGASVLVGADVASQAITLGGGRVPVGVFTALIGGPVFIALLRSGGARMSRGQA